MPIDRRAFIKLSAVGGGAVFASSLPGCASLGATPGSDFHFVQLSDVHWGFSGPAVNPDARGTLAKAIAAVNALPEPPDFVIFTGDLTHTTEDDAERRKRLAEFREQVSALKVHSVHFMAGEHDAALDRGAAWKESFGAIHYSFDHKGVHFVALDNVSDPAARLGAEQLEWLKADLARQAPDAPIVVFAHRPLFDLMPQWDWATRDGEQAISILMPYANLTVFYGHIHQEHHHQTGHIAHHSAKSLIFALPVPGSQPRRDPIKWDPARPYQGLGLREVQTEARGTKLAITEISVLKA